MQKQDIEKPIEKKQKTTPEAVRSDASAPAGQPGPHKAHIAGGKESRVRHILSVLGPGVITGASDDDPSGIGTYSVAGAQFGYGTVWVSLVTYPLSAAIQEVCARIGLVTGEGVRYCV